MKKRICRTLIICFVLSLFFFNGVDACWGNQATNYGETSHDYNLLEGRDLIVNCSLFKENFTINDKFINSSDLVMMKDGQEMKEFTRIIDNRTIQLKIPEATINDSGSYFCTIPISEKSRTLVCVTKVNVGYPPQPVKNFTCLSKNFNNLKCTWNTEVNNVFTNYTIVNYLYADPNYPQYCPDSNVQRNSCEWTKFTHPMFMPYRNVSLTVTGENSLGMIDHNFFFDLYASVILNSPENLIFSAENAQSATITWRPPTIEQYVPDFKLKYEVWITRILDDSSEFIVYEIENRTSLFLENLIPYSKYNISVRCRSAFAESEDMWSNFTTIMVETLPDLPYKAPEVIPEAFEIHMSDHYRSATLYWKTVPKIYHNGKSFHYHIKYYQNDYSKASEIYTVNTTNFYILIEKLEIYHSYTFQIHSANEMGISEEYGTIFISSQSEITPSPRKIRVVLLDNGLYNLSWTPPNDLDELSYIIFWCSSMKPWISRCDKPIDWSNGSFHDTNILLTVPEIQGNYEFAVASKSDNSSSSMKWASYVFPHRNEIPNSPENLEILNISEQSAVIRWKAPTMRHIQKEDLEYEVRVSRVLDGFSKVATKVQYIESNTDFKLENLIPFITYDVSLRCRSIFTKSEDMWSEYTSLMFKTLPDVPYKTPDVIPEAFELHLSKKSRSATLYWKSLPKIYHNGERFKYYIKYRKYDASNTAQNFTVTSTSPFIYIENLQKDSPYIFQIYSANEKGISKDFKSIFIDSQDKILPAPKDVRVSLGDTDYYNLTWNRPNAVDIFSYVVFWCSKLNPQQTRCDNSINWTTEDLFDTNMRLDIYNNQTSFLFAVASKSENGTSSMQWASCVVSRLSRVKYVSVERKTSKTLNVSWDVDCPAERKFTSKYQITYCGLQRDKECRTVHAEPTTNNLLLNNLYPYTNYSVRIRALDNHGKATKDNYPVYSSTSAGAPETPQNVTVTSNSTDAFFVSWIPPKDTYGFTVEYILSYNGSEKHFCDVISEKYSQTHRSHIKIDGLKPYSSYAVQLQACIITPFTKQSNCSEKSESVIIRTKIDVPGHMDPPRITIENSTHIGIKWSQPPTPNGPIDFYVLKWHMARQNASSAPDNILKVYGVHSVVLDLKCSSLKEEGINYVFYMQAVNKREVKNSSDFYGPFSEAIQITACKLPEDLTLYIVSMVGVILGIISTAIFSLLLLFRLIKWIIRQRREYKEIKKLEITLHPELEGQKEKLLNNSVPFQNGSVRNWQSSNSELIFNEANEKNIHTLTDSKFNNSDALEMVLENVKCKEMPKRDSGVYSSISSSMTSEVNSPFGINSSPEIETEISPQNNSAENGRTFKRSYETLPIFKEVHDLSPSEDGQQTANLEKQSPEDGESVDDSTKNSASIDSHSTGNVNKRISPPPDSKENERDLRRSCETLPIFTEVCDQPLLKKNIQQTVVLEKQRQENDKSIGDSAEHSISIDSHSSENASKRNDSSNIPKDVSKTSEMLKTAYVPVDCVSYTVYGETLSDHSQMDSTKISNL